MKTKTAFLIMTLEIVALITALIISSNTVIDQKKVIMSQQFDIEHLGAEGAWSFKQLMRAYGLENCKPANPNDYTCTDKLQEAIYEKTQ